MKTTEIGSPRGDRRDDWDRVMVKKSQRPPMLRPAYGAALLLIIVLGFVGGVASIMRNGGRAPVDPAVKTSIK
jgi:hypothetical protein